MFALGVEFLMGRAVMARPDDRDIAEWPPHPDRVFMALVAAWGERGEDSAEYTALEWLECLPAPALTAVEEFSARTVATNFVPVNDDPKPRTPFDGMAFGRHRTGRTFPAVAPADPVFHLVWQADVPTDHRLALERLCAEVTYLGHSSSPVRVWLADSAPTPTLIPAVGSVAHQLRVPGPGRLAFLVSQYNRVAIDEHEQATIALADLKQRTDAATGKEKSALKKQLTADTKAIKEKYAAGPPQTLRPRPAGWQGYARPVPLRNVGEPAGGFDPGMLVFRKSAGQLVGLDHAPAIALALRGLLMRRYGAESPAWLSGHAPDGKPTRQDRPACLPLGFVGRDYADGRLLGLAVTLPRGFARTDTETLVRLLCEDTPDAEDGEPQMPQLRLRTRVGELVFSLDERPDDERAHTLRSATWTQPSHTWATVTPVLLPRYPRRELTPEDVVARCCTDAGYPEPVAVRVGSAPFLTGVPHVRAFPNSARPGRSPRPLFHALVKFPEPVHGPVLLGAGRYAGYGACRPQSQEDRS